MLLPVVSNLSRIYHGVLGTFNSMLASRPLRADVGAPQSTQITRGGFAEPPFAIGGYIDPRDASVPASDRQETSPGVRPILRNLLAIAGSTPTRRASSSIWRYSEASRSSPSLYHRPCRRGRSVQYDQR